MLQDLQWSRVSVLRPVGLIKTSVSLRACVKWQVLCIPLRLARLTHLIDQEEVHIPQALRVRLAYQGIP